MKDPSSTLEMLPLEVIFSICYHLPTSSAAALSLTSKTMFTRIGRRYIADVYGDYANKFETRRFLKLLAQDLPHLWACESCLCLHRHHWAKSRGDRQLKICILDSDKQDVPERWSTKDVINPGEQQLFSGRTDIDWELLNSIMRMYAAGKDVSQQLGDIETTTQFGSLPSSLSEGTRFRISHQGQLLMKEVKSYHASQTTGIFICPHLFSGNSYRHSGSGSGSRLSSILKDVFTHEDEADQYDCESCGGLQHCHFCPTEFWIRRYDEESTEHVKGFAGMILTRWLNLGDLSDPSEPFWRSHVDHCALTYPDFIDEALSPTDWVPGSIAAAWEKQ